MEQNMYIFEGIVLLKSVSFFLARLVLRYSEYDNLFDRLQLRTTSKLLKCI